MASGTIKAVVPKSDIVDNLTTNDSTKVLSAAQGYALNSKITNIEFKNKLSEQLTEADNINLFGEYIGRGNLCHGLPTTDATYYFLIGLWNTQIAVDSDNSHFYTRIYINNAWTSWRTI